MKHTKFIVYFSNGDYPPEAVHVHALNEEQAKILAMASRIKKGLDFTVYLIEEQ